MNGPALDELYRLRPSLFGRVLAADLTRLATAEKAVAFFLASVTSYLEADGAWLYPARSAAEVALPRPLIHGPAELYDERLAGAFCAEERPEVPRSTLLAPLRAHGRRLGVLGLARAAGEFDLGAGRVLNKLVPILGADLARRDDEQLARVLDRIREKIIAQLRPRDLAYQILDGLAQLVHYDHSAALFLFDPQAKVMRLDAEKVAWTKAKSGFIGLELAAPEALVASLAEPPAIKILTPSSAEDALAALFQPYERYSQGRGIPPVSATLYAPLWVGTELLGLLKIAAFARAPFDARDASIVERFLPAAEVALANVQANLRLEDRAVEAESRAGLVTLARAVAHDVNQAVGTILLLADQARADLADGRGDPVQLAMDLEEILEKASLCRRIFGNMLRVGTERLGAGPVDLNRLVEELVPLFSAQVGGRPIELSFALAESLPVVRASRPHLERILWNLVTNAIEALAGRSGRIEVATERDGEAAVRLAVADNGPGIEAEILNKVQEPFFTTKPNGHGLGLSICRSLAWQLGGSLHLDSTPGEGTRAEVRLPVVAAENAP